MEAAELEKTKAAIEANYTARYDIERVEKWRDIIGEMPFMSFPKDWEVAVIPPFAGAVARFRVKKGAATVSVYADFYERLGCWAEPHWEIYPDRDDDNARFSIANETPEMLSAIAKSLSKQLRDAKRAASGMDAHQGGDGGTRPHPQDDSPTAESGDAQPIASSPKEGV